MSDRWPGGIISTTASAPTGGGPGDAAPGIWTLEQAAPYIANQTWPGTGIPDPQFQYVTALLHGDGFGGGQNNNFIDSSPNNFAIVRYGNTTQGSFSPYGNLWSNYFDGTGDYLQLADNAAWDLSGDYTIECWFYITTTPSSPTLIQIGSSSDFLILYLSSASRYISTAGSLSMTASIPIELNTWNHVALVRSGSGSNNTVMYINGAVAARTTNTTSFTGSASNGVRIGAEFPTGYLVNGYISNVRIVNGSAIYAAAFTPSATPLTAVTNTVLLTCQANRFLDSSVNNFTVTKNGDVSIQRFSPFQNLATYTPARVGGSGYVDGSGDYIEIPSNVAFNLPGDFTVDLWVYFTGNPFGGGASREIFASTVNGGLAFLITGTQLIVARTGIANDLTGNFTTVANTWYHFAISRSSNNMSIYANGVRVANGTISTDYSTGGFYTTAGTQGFLSDWRIVKGTALYDPSQSTLTVPTAPLTAVSGTSLLCNFTNAAIFDNDSSSVLETAGNAQISTSVVKYGTGSMYFDGTGDWLNTAPTIDLEFGSGNFTIECWLYALTTNRLAIYHGSSGTDWSIGIDIQNVSAGFQRACIWASSNGTSWNLINADGGGNGIGKIAFPINTWVHFAYVRSGTTWQTYVNGQLDINLTGISGSIVNRATSQKSIGKWFFANGSGSPGPWNGYIDDFRVTKGYARYWYNFQPPTRAFPNYGGTVIEMEDPLFEYNTLLLNGDGANGGQNNTFVDSSTNNFTITRNGNTTQGSFSPYGSNWSTAFDGSSSTLTMPYNSAFDFGTGNFTIECFVRTSGTSDAFIFIHYGAPTNYHGYGTRVTGSGFAQINLFNGASTQLDITATANPVNNGLWNHVAFVRNGSTVTIYVNGVASGSGTCAFNLTSTSGNAIGSLQYGAFSPSFVFNGNISNLRVTNTAVYTANFIAPTANLTAISGTQLLTLQNNRWIDNSSNGFSVSPYTGTTPQISRFSPFEPSAPYSTSVIGGSGYFDGSGDYLQTPSDAAFGYGTGDFSLEFWAYPDSASVFNRCIFHTDDAFNLELNSGQLMFFQFPTAYLGGTYRARSWVHCCVTRVGTTARMFVDGVLVNNFTFTATKGNSAVQIGANAGSSQFLNGYLSNVRIVKGGIPSAYLTSSTTNGTQVFTPQTTPFTGSEALTGGSVSLLLNTTNAAIPDRAMQNDLETVGNAQISTSVVKYGTGSLYFDGSGDGLIAPSSPNLAFGSGDFTVEGWVYFSGNLPYQDGDGLYSACLFGQSVSNGLCLIFKSGGSSGTPTTLSFTVFGVSTTNTTISTSLNTWYHIAVTRSAGTVRIFINGNQQNSFSNSTTFAQGASTVGYLNIASFFDYFLGYIDDFRITRGIARYVQPFTPPTAALPTY